MKEKARKIAWYHRCSPPVSTTRFKMLQCEINQCLSAVTMINLIRPITAVIEPLMRVTAIDQVNHFQTTLSTALLVSQIM